MITECPYCHSNKIEKPSKENDNRWHCLECDCLFDEDDCEHENYWHKISCLLDGTSIEKPKEIKDVLILPSVEAESCGLSDLEKLHIDKVHQIEGEGTMWYHFEGTPENDEYWNDMSKLSTEDLKCLYEYLVNE